MNRAHDMWKAEEDEGYFRIFDDKKDVVAYVDPDYGLTDSDDAQERIEQMIKSGHRVNRGFLTLPMLKFGIFDTDYSANVQTLESQLDEVRKRVKLWHEFTESWPGFNNHTVQISHTNHDMLSITFLVNFEGGSGLEPKDIVEHVRPILDNLQKIGLV